MFFIYFMIGAISGFMSGLFGIGGGIIIIPALSFIFMHWDVVPAEAVMHMAVGTSLATIIITAISSVYAHHKRGAVQWDRVIQLLPGLLGGSICGAVLSGYLPSGMLRVFFGLFLIVVGIRLLQNPKASDVKILPSVWSVRIVTFFIGELAGMLGVGGGVLIVPYLLRCQLDMRNAVGTSIACGMAIGIVATLTYMLTGLISFTHIPWSTGYIYWPAFLGVGVMSILFAPLGALLAHKLPGDLLKRIFAVLILLIAGDMLY